MIQMNKNVEISDVSLPWSHNDEVMNECRESDMFDGNE